MTSAWRDDISRYPPPARLKVPLHQLALFLDIDGTLAHITAHPHLTRVPLRTRRTLQSLQRAGVAIAGLSGRPLLQVRRLLYPLDVPVGGSHGAQITLGLGRSVRKSSGLPAGLAELLETTVSAWPGVWLERKPASLAIHWRQARARELDVERLMSHALLLAPGWIVMRGHCVHELRLAGHHKGKALQWLMRRPGFVRRCPIAIGDDRTDEDAFAAALNLGGMAIHVGEREDTLAPWRLRDVDALAAWLEGQLIGF